MARRFELTTTQHREALQGARAMGLFFCMICLGLWFATHVYAKGSWHLTMNFAVFGPAALALLGGAFYKASQAKRLAPVRLVLDQLPEVGTSFAAQLELPAGLPSIREARAKLSREETPWQQEKKVPFAQAQGGGRTAAFTFLVPANQPAAEWDLVVETDLPELGLRWAFRVPVRPPLKQRLQETAGRREFEARDR